ncbi:MAG TPA: FIST C-terminal domain-containing protein, partial [Spirochaetales bacterium]|nr:FIST C-terminal domain-containing protein [Spirochaetales bacterium]
NAREALGEANRRLGEVRGALLFNCVLRYLELKASRSTDAFNDIFAAAPFIGFNTFGEELFTHHNQTLTAIFIGR